VFPAAGADFRAVGAGAAVGANLHTVTAQIAVEAEIVRTLAAPLAAAFADHGLLAAGRARRAVLAVCDGAFHAEAMRRANVRAVGADAALLAVFLAAVAVAPVAFGAVEPLLNGALHADDLARYFGAIIANLNAFGAQAADLAPLLDCKIAPLALRTVAALFHGAFLADNAHSQIGGAPVADGDALGTLAALIAPQSGFEVALVALRAVVVFVDGAVYADIAALHFGTGGAYLPSRTVGAQSALITQLAAFVALVTALAIR